MSLVSKLMSINCLFVSHEDHISLYVVLHSQQSFVATERYETCSQLGECVHTFLFKTLKEVSIHVFRLQSIHELRNFYF